MASPLHLISGRDQLLQLAKPGALSHVRFYEPLRAKPIVEQETLDFAIKVHPVLFRKKQHKTVRALYYSRDLSVPLFSHRDRDFSL